ncbi:PREDICTED: zinc finger protein 32-like [Nicrophorus vespilloides]|uniref:Zinc finger protein 32-like n=1 Tax=Nicrophorus vespilloides TaxID=110193 RepID=A0ABM1ND32_NICVS|nr:PREDICTED: zinc finger protein 32-like [Nicrophorus vespilloides]
MEDIIRDGSLRLFATESSCDVILSCSGYRLIAHKVILSIASPVFQELLRQDSSQPTMVILPDISANVMTLILDYIYNGHVSIYYGELHEFLSVARFFKLRLDYKEESPRCGKPMPELIPISEMRNPKRGSFNKVIPSPWITHGAQVFEDPRIPNVDFSSPDSALALCQKSDANNNNVEDVPSKNDPEENPKLEVKSAEINEIEDQPKLENVKKQKPYKCEDCGKTFSQLRNYKYHRSIHDGTKEFATRCPECGKVFNDKGYLSSHLKIHRDRKEYACQHCPKRFNQRVAYNMHIRIHTGVKPHECQDCGKSFSRKMLLKQHQRVHTGERPYVCAECGKSFADRSNMSLHARLHTGVKPYSCTLCTKSFTKKHHLKTHMNFHTGSKPYSCQNCSLAFSQSSNMRTHYKKCILKTSE